MTKEEIIQIETARQLVFANPLYARLVAENERLKAESIPEYISRLKEVLKHTGELAETDIDYVYYLMEYDLQPPKQ